MNTHEDDPCAQLLGPVYNTPLKRKQPDIPDLLTPAELAAIAEREAKASKGPWHNRHDRAQVSTRHDRVVARCLQAGQQHNDMCQMFNNGDFIAHARKDIPALLRHIAALEARTPAPADDPAMDGTDFAHPAWWRGHEHTIAVTCQKVNEILDGKDDGAGENLEGPWRELRRRLLGMVQPAPAVAPDHVALIAEAREKFERAERKLQLLCHGKETFTMRIPADRTHDHDLIFAEAFRAGGDLADALTAANAREAKRSNFGNLSKETTEVIEGLRGWNNDPKLLSQAGESQLAVLELADALDNWKTEAEENADLVVSLEAQLAALRKEAAEAIEAGYKSGITETSSMPGPRIIEQMWQDSEARRAALDINPNGGEV